MKGNDYSGIWVFAEQRGGEVQDVSLELLGKARGLAEHINKKVTAILMGHQVRGCAPMLINHGADVVLVADALPLENYRLLLYTHVLERLIREYEPEIFLLGATSIGIELAPRVAARLQTGLSAHCIDLKIGGKGELLQVVPGWGGNVVATITCPGHRPQMATVMPGAMRKGAPGENLGEIRDAEVSLPEDYWGPEVLEVKREREGGLPLEKAEVVVAGGWGVGNKENWGIVEELARVLGGAVGATRPPVDEGWADEKQMIGQSGKTVRPTLYIGVGISGMMHHVVGMDQSQHIIGINSDPRAEIFNTCDVMVVEDFKKILPPLIEELKVRRS